MASEEEHEIVFGDFVEFIHEGLERDESFSIEHAVDRTVASNDISGVLELDRAPESDLENRVLQDIVQKDKMHMLAIIESVDAAKVPGILDQIQQNLHTLYLDGIPMTGSQADVIFQQMDNNCLADLTVHFRKDYCQGFVRALVGFIKNSSSVDTLMLTRHTANDWVTEETFQSLCTAILSSSVNTLNLDRLRVRGHGAYKIHKILAKLIENSTSISKIEVEPFDASSTFLPGDFSVQLLSHALCQTPAIRNLDISFIASYSNGDGDDALIVNRHPWWKRHLGDMDTVPLKLLPLVLEKADKWKCDTSHSHLDVLFFLLKEKNPILLQNVRRRRIRKRKRYGFDA
jgi:hypothetical protein